MTVKERLWQIVEELDDEQAVDVLRLLHERCNLEQSSSLSLPAWVGAGWTKDGETDISARAKEIVQAELGRSAA